MTDPTDEQYLHGDPESPSTTKYADAASDGTPEATETSGGPTAPAYTPEGSETAPEAGDSLFSAAFWKGAGERAIKTFAQSTLGGLLVAGPIVEQPWPVILGVAATATLASLLTSIINPRFTAGR